MSDRRCPEHALVNLIALHCSGRNLGTCQSQGHKEPALRVERTWEVLRKEAGCRILGCGIRVDKKATRRPGGDERRVRTLDMPSRGVALRIMWDGMVVGS
ncbi:hypothetical protein PG993_011744 [Apiospora rasikravindrae]|uniref:Uncharacterized protein n=1 Tax=Apiospora rasikravindrae TaxID=990691 RepID=A0ABR1S0Z6_9PEZI